MGAFPADDPEYVILIIADEPGGDSYYGSVVATPYAKLVIENIIDYKNYPVNNLDEDLKMLEKIIVMPNLIGESVDDAISELNELGLQVEVQGEGDVVLFQLPPEGTMLSKNSIVVISTN